MPSVARYTAPLIDLDTHFVFDDFSSTREDNTWIDTITDSGSVTTQDNENGVLLLDPSDCSVGDNDEAYVCRPIETFLVESGRVLYYRARISFQEQNTDDANVMVGLMSAVNAVNTIVDNGGGPRASGNLFVVEKRDGETEWRFTTRNSSAVTTTLSTTTAGVSNDLNSFQEIEIFVFDLDGGTNVEACAKVDGMFLRDTNNIVITHRRLIASSTEMMPFAAVKNGDTNNELLYVDYIYAHQSPR